MAAWRSPYVALAHLAVKYEVCERGPVDPVQPAKDGERRQAPPRVANVLQLLGPAVQPAAARLPLAQPEVQVGGVAGQRLGWHTGNYW